MIGKRFGRWLVSERGEDYIFPSTGYTLPRYNCMCDCGNTKLVRASSLLDGESKSCGCLAAELASKRSRTHGLSKNKLYSVWCGMIKRCSDSTRKDYHHYGGRGITVCGRWKVLENFIEDMQETYKEGLEIERIDVNGNYEPSNCTWANRRTQVINRRPSGSCFDTKFIEYKGKTLCLSEWSEELGIDYQILINRLGKLKWSAEKAFNTKYRAKFITVTVNNMVYSLTDIFVYPSNIFSIAKRNNCDMAQFVANVFCEKAKVTAQYAKDTVEIKVTNNLSSLITTLNIRETFRQVLKGVKYDELVK